MENENVKISKVCGLCAGCKFAIDTAQKQLDSEKKVTLFKEIVHNKNVNAMLEKQGVVFEDDIENLPSEGVVILRAHGEPKQTYNILSQNKINYIDCTCVNVKKIHDKVQEYSANGFVIVIIGKYGKKTGIMHPEILGTVGWCESEPILIEDAEDLTKIENTSAKKLYVVCQTTFNMEKADKLIENIQEISANKNIELIINKSICMAQKQINVFSAELAKECDLMIVVGGKNSSNTTELFNNLKTITKSIFLENIYDAKSILDSEGIKLSKNIRIGLTAGASTMKSELEQLKTILEKMIEEV